jgi:hypothetical protein
MPTRLDYVRMVLTVGAHVGAWSCIVCLGADVRHLGGNDALAGMREAIDLLRGMPGFEHGAGHCSRCRCVSSDLVRYIGRRT